MSALEIFDLRPGYIFFCILGIFDGCPGDVLLVSWRYFIGVLEIFDGCPGDILCLSRRYFICVL